MSTAAADGLRAFLAPLLTGWRIQFGRWIDGTNTDRYCVIKPAGGLPASLVREPQFTVLLIGGLGDESTVPGAAADAVIEAMRAGSGSLVHLQPAEPVYSATGDGRHVFEFAVSAITN
jgi:hypothetical protein